MVAFDYCPGTERTETVKIYIYIWLKRKYIDIK